ncbi:MAG: hypothetical protein ACLFR7_05925, partial [Opitutales bacterium]
LVGLALMLSLIPAAFHAAMGGLMFLYKINDDYYERMKRGEIEGLKPVAGLMHSDHVPPGTEAPLP